VKSVKEIKDEKTYTISDKDAALIVHYLGVLRMLTENTSIDTGDEWERMKAERDLITRASEIERLQNLFLPLEIKNTEPEKEPEPETYEWGRFPVRSPIEGESRCAWVLIRDDAPCILYGQESDRVVPFEKQWGGRIVTGSRFQREITKEEAQKMAKEYAGEKFE